jgi:hypothetical protein
MANTKKQYERVVEYELQKQHLDDEYFYHKFLQFREVSQQEVDNIINTVFKNV